MTVTLTPTELIQECYAAFGRGDIPFILDQLSSDCRWIALGEGIPASGEYTGPAGAAAFFQKLNETEDILRFEVRQILASGEDVVALGYEECRVRATGKMANTNWAMHFRVTSGKVSYFETFFNTAAYALAHAA